MREAAKRYDGSVPELHVEPDAADADCTLSCLAKLLARRRRMAELGLCGARASCHWHLRALDRAIVSYLLLAGDLGLEGDAEALLAVCGLPPRSRAA